jgi:hypothetical protein
MQLHGFDFEVGPTEPPLFTLKNGKHSRLPFRAQRSCVTSLTRGDAAWLKPSLFCCLRRFASLWAA